MNDEEFPDDVEIRVKNISSLTYNDVFVNTGGGKNNFGDIPSNKYSDYYVFNYAYRYAYVELKVNGETYKVQPIDYFGEKKLDPGKYTYKIDFIGDGGLYSSLTLEFVKD